MLCFIISRKAKMQLKCKKKTCAVNGEGAVTDQTCEKWFEKFYARYFLLDDAPWLGRPVIKVRHYLRTMYFLSHGR